MPSINIKIRELRDKSKATNHHIDNIQVDYCNNSYIIYYTNDLTDDWKYETPCRKTALALIMFRIRDAIIGITEISTLSNERFDITVSAREFGITVSPMSKFNHDNEFECALKDYAANVLSEMRICVKDLLNIIGSPVKDLLREDVS